MASHHVTPPRDSALQRPRQFARGQRMQRAFSLAELLLVIFLIGVVTSIGVPRFGSFLANQHVEAAARRIVVDLSLARRYAKLKGSSLTVQFNTGADEYTLQGVSHPDRPSPSYMVSLKEEPYNAELVSVSFGGAPQVVFDGYGGVLGSGGSIVIQCGAYTRTILVDAQTGRAMVQ